MVDDEYVCVSLSLHVCERICMDKCEEGLNYYLTLWIQITRYATRALVRQGRRIPEKVTKIEIICDGSILLV